MLRYTGRVREWIPGFKRRSTPFGPALATRLAIDFLAGELARRVATQNLPTPDLIIPIPLHPRRRRRRGFNHCDWIATRIGRILDLPVDIDLVQRTRNTRPQASLRHLDRARNVQGAFRASRSMRTYERVWLVDDVLTTGATLDAAAEACLAAGSDEVHALTLAATPPRRRNG